MSIFSLCDFESEVQLNDKTRFNASKSFAAKDSIDLTTLTIKPTDDGSAIDCFSPSASDRYLDWVFTTFSIDVNSANNDLVFNEGGSDISTTLTAGTYTLSQYAAHVKAKMDAAGTQTYTFTVGSNEKITISAASSFEFKPSSVTSQLFVIPDTSLTSHVTDVVGYGIRNVTVAIGNGTDSDSKSFAVKVYSVDGDYLFSNDGDLTAHEPEIMKWVEEGRSSFLNAHRRSQKLIMAWIDEKGYVNVYGNKYSKRDIIDIEEVKQWSIFLTLRLIFQGISNAVDDVFDRKAKQYGLNEEAAKQRVILRLDTNEDGTADETEGLSIYSGSLFRR